MKKQLMTLCAAAVAMIATAETPLWMRYSRISPDGQTIAFTYQGDLWTVPVKGGEARRITSGTSYETYPVWSSDSKKIAYASDSHGSKDVYVVDAGGGPAKRLTTNSAQEIPEAFSKDGSRVYYRADIQKPKSSSEFPSSRMTQLYSVSVDGGNPVQELGSAVQLISFLPDGESFLYQDIKGQENEWRKHHTSSVTRDIWLYDAQSGNSKNLTNRPGEDRNPVVSKDGKTVYFLSERNGGTFNVYEAPINDMSKAKALTSFKTHPVRFLSMADNGTLSFGYDGELYTMTPGSEPQKVNVSIVKDAPVGGERISVKAKGGVPSNDGKQFAFTDRGEVFVTSVEYPSIKQVTHTAAKESNVAWHPKGRELVYQSLRDGHYNIYSAKIARKDDPNFSNATLIDEAPVIAVDDIERTVPQFSPDGKKLAFIQDRHKLMVMDTKTKQVKQLTDGSHYKYSNGEYDYEWSPDSRWILLEVDDNRHSPYNDIAIINVETGEIVPLTRSGYTDERPLFVMDGNAVVFLTERWGMRNHASWGTQSDAAIVFLNQDAYDRFKLSEEDYQLRKEVEKARKKKTDDGEKKDEGKDKKKDKKKKDNKDNKDNKDAKGDEEKKDDSVKPIVVEVDGIMDRIERLTPYSSNLAGAWVDKDGRKLYYLSSVEKGYDLWEMEIEDGKPSIAARMDMKNAFLIPNGETLFIVGDKIKTFNTNNSKVKDVTGSTTMELDYAAERQAMMDFVYLSEREMFYNKNMHGVDWDGLTEDYRKFLPHINNNYDFAEMLSEYLGELNVSHTGSGYRSNEANDIVDRTASLGLLYDLSYDGDGLKVAEILEKGPFDNAYTALKEGDIIVSVNGQKISSGTENTLVLNNLAGKKTLVEFYNPKTGKHEKEVVLPITAGANGDLLYNRWVKGRAAYVDSLSNGRLGYVHIEGMDDASFRKVYSDILGKYNDREGVVIDIRWNGGGRLHEDIEVLFSGDKYFTQVIRDVETCDMPSRRYNKPSIMVMGEACYSNAHGTPWVYKHRNIGKLVGMPVPGTMTSVNWVNLQDPSLYFGIPVVGYQLPDGSYLENQQLEPDIKVVNLPQDVRQGIDAQLKTAVEELLKEIDAKN